MATNEEMPAFYFDFLKRISDVEENPRNESPTLEGYQNQLLVTVYSALQKLNINVGSVSHDLLLMKKRRAETSEDNMSLDESTAIYLYTAAKMPNYRPLYECLNHALRAKDMTIIRPYFWFLKLFTTALLRLDPVKQIVFRGIKADLSEKYSVGKIFVWSGFSSCTTSGQILSTEHFPGSAESRTLFMIHCSSGRNIRQHSSLSTEDEIILLPGTKFKVISTISPSIDLHIIEIQEIASSNLFRPHFPSITNRINTVSVPERNSEHINIQMINMDNDLENLFKNIEEQRNNREAEFSSIKLNDNQVPLIVNELKTNIYWKILKLNQNKICGPGMAHLSPALVLNSTLETLILDKNYVDDYGTGRLTQALKQNFTLVHLTLSNNNIKDAGAKSLAELLRTNSTLTDLSLDDNLIGDDGMIALCDALEQYNRTLKKLSINNNNITDQSVEAIVTLYNMNYVLEKFRYDGNKFSKKALYTLLVANKKSEKTAKSLVCINEVAVVYLEIKSKPDKQLSRDASFLFTNFRRLLNAEALENFTKIQKNSTTYLILCCEDDSTIQLISSFCSKRKILLYVLQTTNPNIDKNSDIFNCEEPMIFRLTTRIATHYRSLRDQAIRMKKEEEAQIYSQQGIDIQQKLINYLKKRRIHHKFRQNDTDGIPLVNQFPRIQTSKSLITVLED